MRPGISLPDTDAPDKHEHHPAMVTEKAPSPADGNTRSFNDHFSRVSKSYAEFRPSYPDALFSWLAGLPGARTLAWDCATGTGQAAAGLAEYFDQVIATDASREQIGSAQALPRVEYREAPAESSGIESASVDLLTVAQALHWFDIGRFFLEAQRVLKPGGVLAVWAYGPIEIEGEPAVNDIIQEFYHNVVGPFWPSQRKLVDEGYRNIELPFPYIPAPAFSMRVAWSLQELLGYIRTWSAVTRFIRANDTDPVSGLGERLACLRKSTGSLIAVSWPLAVKAAGYPG